MLVLDEIIEVTENGLPPRLENEEDMGIRKEDWTLIHAELDKRIEALKPRGWNKFREWAQEIGIITSYISIMIAMAAVTFGALYFAFNRVSTEGKFQGDTSRHLDEIDKHLANIDKSILESRLISLSGQPATTQSVAAIKQIFETSRSSNQPLSPTVVTDAGEVLVRQSDNPQAWQAASALINYRYADSVQAPESKLPNCFNLFKGYQELEPHKPGAAWVHEQMFGNCRLNIDDVAGYFQSGFGKSLMEHRDPSGVVLRMHLHDGIVVYNGGELIPFQSLECLRCTFRINAKQPPPVLGQKLLLNLIASDPAKVSLSGPQAGQ